MAIDLTQVERSYAIAMFRMDSKARLRLWRKLAKMIKDGIAIVVAMEELKNLRKKGEPMEIALGEWIAQMKNGKKLSDAIKDWVSTEESMLISAGEQSGSLTDAMSSVVKVAKAKQSIQAAVLGGIAYPAFLVILSFGVMYLFSYKIIPAFSKAIRGDGWVGMARVMIDTAIFAQNWLHWIALLTLGLIIFGFVSLPTWAGPMRTVVDRYPPYSIYRVMQGSSWLISMSSLIEAGVRIDSALEQLMKAAPPWAKVRIAACLRGIRSGKNLGDALQSSGYEFPDQEIISDIRVYATKSGFDEALRLIADEWITESVERIQAMMNVVFGATLALAAIIVGFEVSGLIAMQLQLTQIMTHPMR